MIPEILLKINPYTDRVESEIWVDVVNCVGSYKISNYGRILSLGRMAPRPQGALPISEKIVKQWKNPKGYSTIRINGKTHLVHRLLLMSFGVPNPNNLPEVHHIDGTKENNVIWNLEWISTRENGSHKFLHLKKSSKFIGVRWDPIRNKWRSDVQINGVAKYLGHSENEQGAHQLYLDALERAGLTNKFANNQ